MVEYKINLDVVFGSLADPTRRDILKRVSKQPLSIGMIAGYYKVSFAAIAKHIGVLEEAKLVTKQRQGKQQIVQVCPKAIQAAATYFEMYQAMWEDRFGALDEYLDQTK